MRFRFFLAAALALLVVSPAAAQTVLKIATLAPEGTDAVKSLKAAGDEIATATSNRVTIKVYPGGVMGKDDAVLKKMKIGQIDGATFTAGGLATVERDYQILSLPMLFKSYDEVDHLRPEIEPLINAKLETKGYVAVANMEIGFVYMMAKKPITNLEDLKGLKIWAPEDDPISETAFKEMGITGVPLPISDVLTGLKTGLIDTYANSPVGAVALQWFTASKYVTQKPLLYTYSALAFDKKRLDRLSPEDQKTVRSVFNKHMSALDKSVRDANKKAMETLKSQGLQFVSVTPEGEKQMESVATNSREKLVAAGAFSPEMAQKVKSLLEAYRAGK